MSCDSQCSVAFPYDTVGSWGWSAVCECGISLSYSLALFTVIGIKKYTCSRT